MLSHSTLRQRRSQKTLSSARPRQHAHPPPLARPPRRRPPPAPLHLRRHPLGVFLAYAGEPPPQGNCIKLGQSHVRLPESGWGTPCGCPSQGITPGTGGRFLSRKKKTIGRGAPRGRPPSAIVASQLRYVSPDLRPPIPLAKSAHMCDNSLQPNPRRPSANSRRPQSRRPPPQALYNARSTFHQLLP